jgi:hypothetical protein
LAFRFLKTKELAAEPCLQRIENRQLPPNTPGGERGYTPWVRPGNISCQPYHRQPAISPAPIHPKSDPTPGTGPQVTGLWRLCGSRGRRGARAGKVHLSWNRSSSPSKARRSSS